MNNSWVNVFIFVQYILCSVENYSGNHKTCANKGIGNILRTPSTNLFDFAKCLEKNPLDLLP